MSWQMPSPDGGDALGWEVEITAHLELVRGRPMRVLAISGSVRQGWYNTALLRAAAERTAGDELVGLGQARRCPGLDEDLDTVSPPPAVATLARRSHGRTPS